MIEARHPHWKTRWYSNLADALNRYSSGREKLQDHDPQAFYTTKKTPLRRPQGLPRSRR
jgi:hypothetical protein